MLDNCLIKAPAKLNFFLKIIGKKSNGYHLIRSGITFLNLYNEVFISLSNKNSLNYTGKFAPSSSIFKNDIIIKVLNNISIKKKNKISVTIKKNIPWQAGLGSASTDAASFIKGLQKLGIAKKVDNKFLTKIGSDVPACYYRQNCIITGIGDKINTNIDFPKYYFVLVNPFVRLSTSYMYNKIKDNILNNKNYIKEFSKLETLSQYDKGNDFEKIARNESSEIAKLLNFLSNIKFANFVGMSGSGSCCYVAFKSKKNAITSFEIISKKYSKYWTYFAENNIVNN